MRKWYEIKAKAEGEGYAEIYIFDEIGYWGVTARQFISELKHLDADQINLHIDSPGGSVFDGVAIQNSLKHHKATVTTYIDGLAGSIASIIALGGETVRIADNAYVMIHNPASIVWGEAKDLLKEAEVLDKIADGLAGDYSRKMGISVEEARALMDEETWYLGQEAVDAGFADATFTGAKAAASFDVKRFSNKAPKAVLDRFQQQLNQTEEKSVKTNATKEEAQTETAETPADDNQVDTATKTSEQSEASAAEQKPENKAEPQNVDEAVREALAKERQRTSELNALGNKFGFTSDAEKFVKDGKSVEEFRAHILNKSPDDWKASLEVKNPSQQEMESGETDSETKEALAKIKERRKSKS